MTILRQRWLKSLLYGRLTLLVRHILVVYGRDWLEAAFKKAMVALLGNRSLTDEVSLTTMYIVEQTLNGRTNTPASNDPEDLESLTSNHFTLGGANVCIPFISNAEVYANHRKIFRSTQAYADMIWE